MKLFIQNIVKFLSLVFLILFGYGLFCDYFFKQQKYLPADNKRTWVIKQQYDSFDYAVLGSSRAENAFDLRLLDSLTGMKGINIAVSGAGYVDNYLVLHKFITNQNKISHLFLQVDIFSMDPESNFSNSFHVYTFLPYWKDPVFKKAIAHYISTSDSLLFEWLPWIRFYKYNKFFSPSAVLSRLRKSREKDNSFVQVVPSSRVRPSENPDSNLFFKPVGSKYIRPNHFDLEYLGKIIELAQQNNIEVTLFTSPDYINNEKIISNYRACNDTLLEIISKSALRYIPCDSALRSDIHFFLDPVHLNNYGRYLYTLAFGKNLIKTDLLQKTH